MPKKLRLKCQHEPAMIINRVAFKHSKFVYVALANKAIKYPVGRSRIVYIGTTKRGARRIASSLAWKGADMLFEHGVKSLEVFIVLTVRRRGMEAWKKLERALLLRFRELHHSVPRANTQGKKMQWRDEHKYFTHDRLDAMLKELGG